MWTNGVLTVLPQPGSEPAYTTYAYAVSGDGSTVLGIANGKGTYWTSSDGFSVAHVLPVLPGDDAPTGGRLQLPLTTGDIGAKLCSTDGSKIIGNSLHVNFPSPSTATGVVWTNGTITTSLPNSNNPGGVFLQSCSSDGISLIAGWTFDGSTAVACIWLNGTTQHDLNALPSQVVSCDESGSVVCLPGAIYIDSLSTNHGGTPNLYGNAHVRGVPPGYGSGPTISCFASENNLIAGGWADDGTGHNGAVRWNGSTGNGLGVVGATTTQINALSGDGAIAVGIYATGDGIFQPVYWDAGDTSHALDNPFPSGNSSVDYVSRDGTIGVGSVQPPSPLNTGFVFVAAPITSSNNARPRAVLYW
jgi:hypothetical protein